MSELLLKDEVFAIIGAAMEVHSELGSGFLEAVYQEALEIELADRGISFVAQKPLKIIYKGRVLKKEYLADVECYEQIIVEIKAMDQLTPREESQLINYLHATGHRVGLLINFGASGRLEWKRLVN
ncbi:MAG: GxxExxY protein [Tepidisphaerales bacterium]